jgi:ABC-type nitrate/sulfonate/bicarbonate transport system substrate-binding protein
VTHLRIGGVPEHFNLPWRLAIEERALVAAHPGVSAEWIDFPGGTGAIMGALDRGEIDLATPLTEGAVTAIAGGVAARIVGLWVDSPLLWGIHVAGGSPATSVADVVDGRFAISRFGSGSELMSRMLARERGWPIDDDRFVVVRDIEGAAAALPAGEAEVFLWNKSMTQPLVDAGTFERVGVIPTPWPAFCVAAAGRSFIEQPELLTSVRRAASERAQRLKADPALVELVVRRYGLARRDAAQWAEQVRWSEPSVALDVGALRAVNATMLELGRASRLLEVEEWIEASVVE